MLTLYYLVFTELVSYFFKGGARHYNKAHELFFTLISKQQYSPLRVKSNVMAELKKSDGIGQDISQANIYNVSQGMVENVRIGGGDIRVGDITQSISSRGDNRIVIDDAEIANLLDWLAAQQGITREIALKKAVATAAYVYDITVNQGSKLCTPYELLGG
mgnify:CR=1 FL=1